MKTRHLKSILAIFAATLTLAAFNNFTYMNWKGNKVGLIEKVHEASRVAHAKELLGKLYKGSSAQKLEGSKELNYLIFSKVREQLPTRFQSQARSIARTVITESEKLELDPVFVLAVIRTESKFDPTTIGQFGEIGLMQIKPDTAEWIAKKYNISWSGPKTLKNPTANIRIGLAYMDYLRSTFSNKASKYVSAYNMGPRNLRRLLAQNQTPVEYNGRVMKNYSELYSLIMTEKTSTTKATVAAN
jgi:soluble lytic murein transglycosylase